MIPKKIYQTWISKNLPDRVQAYVDEMLSLNPSYEYQLYDDEDIFYFVKENYDKDILSAYEKLDIGAAKSDLWRYLVLYKNGGVYLDLDSHIYNDLDKLIKENDKAIISREGSAANPHYDANGGIFVQWCLIFSKDHPILEKTFEKCVYNIKNETTQDIWHLTGPSVYSSAIREVLSPLDMDVYKNSDKIIANKMESSEFNNIKCRAYSYDYGDFCIFQHPDSRLLTVDKPHWQEESKTKSVFKKD